MINLYKLGDEVFNLMVRLIDKKTRNSYRILITFEGCNLLIRPFILSDIIMVSGLYEPYVRDILNKQIEKSVVLVDVGANIGVYVIPFAKKVAKVIAYEPHPQSFEILEKNILLNQLHNVRVVKKPVGRSKEKVLFQLPAVPAYAGIDVASDLSNAIQTETVDLDTDLSMEDRIDWLLIDVEGYEVFVLKGAMNILRKYSPKIIIEVFPKNVEMVKEILTNEGYSFTHLFNIEYYAYKN